MGNKQTVNFPTNINVSNNCEEIPEEDIGLLRNVGFEFTPKCTLGSGRYGIVYKGIYGDYAQHFRDIDGELLKVISGHHFACKYINIKNKSEKKVITREFVEKVNNKLKKLLHPNIVQIDLMVNFGECHYFCLNNDINKIRAFYDRLYLFMKFANFGNLNNYLKGLKEKGLKISEIDSKNWCRQLSSGLDYLHRELVIHGKITSNNVLLFREFAENESEIIVAKLSDYGFNEYEFQSTDNEFEIKPSDKSDSTQSSLSSESSFGKLSISAEVLTDISLLSKVLQKMIEFTDFSCNSGEKSAKALISSMQDLVIDDMEQVLKHSWLKHEK